MSSSPWPRAGAFFFLGLAAISCGGDKLGPDRVVSEIDIFPKTARLYTVGQQVVFTTTLTTEAGSAGDGIPITYASRDENLVTITQAGVATSKVKGGSTWIVTTAGGKSDSAEVELPLTTCGSTAATTLTVGQVATDIGASGFCASASAGDYAVIVHNNSLAGSGFSSYEISGVGIGMLSGGGASFAKGSPALRSATSPAAFGTAIRRWRRDVAAEMRHRRKEALDVAPYLSDMRAFARARRATFAVAPPAIGSTMHINVNIGVGGSGCNDSTMVDARVAAVSNSAIVLADPRNPDPGYTDDEYNEFAQMFDSVINPLDVATYGAPSDIDNNERALLVFTRSINEQTPNGADFFVGGLTHLRDLAPKTDCKASNQAEMFYLLVPDSLGLVNGNRIFTKGFVSSVTNATIAHEYQHLINFARRRILAPTVQPVEEVWLNEGLSHIAEELLFYHRSGRSPRANFSGADLNAVDLINEWVDDASGDFLNFDSYAYTSSGSSPFAAGDALSTRGGTWTFLRYVADQKFASDGTFWYDLVNSGDVGIANLEKRLNNMSDADFKAMLRDFVVAVYADDLVAVDPKYTLPSWNMRSLYPRLNQLFDSFQSSWPVPGIPLEDSDVTSLAMAAGGFEVYLFRGLSGADSFIRVTGNSGAALPAGFTISVVRIQ
jgi:hypothetical protein